MLDAIVLILVAALVGAGIWVMLGPGLRSRIGLGGRARPSGTVRVVAAAAGPIASDVHPTTHKALVATSRILQMLDGAGLERQAGALRAAGRRLRMDEPKGIYAMREVLRQLRSVELPQPRDQHRLEELLRELHRRVADRAEQLELLPRP